jgi:hypothetical protein
LATLHRLAILEPLWAPVLGTLWAVCPHIYVQGQGFNLTQDSPGLQVELAPVQKAAVSREVSRQANFAKSAKGSNSIKSFFGRGKG